MTATTNLTLPMLAAEQAQKHVTHNEALLLLDSIVQLAVLDRDLTAPPVTPSEGDRYIPASGATGDWAGKDLNIAVYQDGAWSFLVPKVGWRCWVADERALLVWIGAPNYWADLLRDGTLTWFGVNAAADATNRLALKSDAALFSHDDVTPGSGDMQVKVNKATTGNTGSVLFQTNWSGRAEFGLTGDDDWRVKVSADGSSWIDAIVVDRATGEATIQGLRSAPANGAAMSSVLFTPGGDGTVSIYRTDTTSGQNPRTATIASIAGDVITLTMAVANTFFANIMNGVSMARIWNTTLSVDQHNAWLIAYVAGDKLQVSDAADISGWSAGDTIQIGDPITVTPNRCITLDISPMLTNLFGQPFRQTGIIVKSNILTATDGDSLSLSADGAGGSFVTAAAAPSSAGVAMIPCTELSPLSNSNLVRIREGIVATAGIRLVSSMAVLR